MAFLIVYVIFFPITIGISKTKMTYIPCAFCFIYMQSPYQIFDFGHDVRWTTMEPWFEFDKDNKISLVHGAQTGSGSNPAS